MLRRLWGCLFAAIIFAGVSSSGTEVQKVAPPTAGQLQVVTAATLSAESEKKLHAAFDHLYNLEFSPALELFEQVAQAEPESASVRAFWASALLYQILASQGSLQSQLFVTSNEFLKHPRLPPDPELDRRFHAVTQEAQQRAQRRLKENPQDVDGLFALGLLYGNQADYAAGVKAEYLRGVGLGEKAYDYHQKLRELHPEFLDTGVVLGVHDYVIGSLPRVHRFFLFFIGTRGSRERGLGYLQETAAQGHFLRTYAQILLSVAWIREQQLERALPLVEDLRSRYPRNPIFTLELAKLYRQQERYAQAAQLCRELLAELSTHPHNPRVIGPEDALLELGLVEAAQGNSERALELLRQVGEIPGAGACVWAQALLERGQIFDRLGRRQQALAEYEKVIGLAADPEVTRLAFAYRKRPYQPNAKH